MLDETPAGADRRSSLQLHLPMVSSFDKKLEGAP
jgi:hypothetical protein